MKLFSLKQLLVMVFVGLMAMAGTSLGDLPPGNGDANGSENDNGSGDMTRARDGSCEEEFLGILESGGQGNGQNQNKNQNCTSCEHNEYKWGVDD